MAQRMHLQHISRLLPFLLRYIILILFQSIFYHVWYFVYVEGNLEIAAMPFPQHRCRVVRYKSVHPSLPTAHAGGRSKLSTFFLGSEAERIVQMVKNIPVLILKEKEKNVGLWDILTKL